MNGTVVLVIVEIPGYAFIEAFGGASREEALKNAEYNWNDTVKITFVKELSDEVSFNCSDTGIQVLRELERDGRFIARKAAQIQRSEMALAYRLRTA